MTARVLELAGPADVGLLVEACLDLDDHQHLLACLGSIDEGVDDRGVARGAIEGLLDGEHVGVGGGLLDEPLHRRGEGVIGVVQQDVVAAYGVEDVDRLGRLDLGQQRVSARHERRELQLLAGEVGDAVEPGEVERAGEPEDLPLVDVELGDQQVQHARVDGLLDLEADRRPEAAAQQLLLESLEEVLGVVLLDLQVLVAGDAEGVDLEDLHAGEEPFEVLADHVLERDEPLVAERHEAVEDRRHLDPGEVLGAGVGVAHQHCQVERQTGDVRERMGRVDGQRREHGEDPLLEHALGEALLVAVELVPAQQLDALGAQRGDDAVAEHPGVAAAGAGPDRIEGLARHHAGGRAYGDAGGDPTFEARHPDHEELVEVAGEDRQEPGTLQQRQGLVLGQLENALVEPQPRELAVHEPVVEALDVGAHLLGGQIGRRDVEGVGGMRERVRAFGSLVQRRGRVGRQQALGRHAPQSVKAPTVAHPPFPASSPVDKFG